MPLLIQAIISHDINKTCFKQVSRLTSQVNIILSVQRAYLCLISESGSHDNVDEVLVGEPGAVADVVHVVVACRPARGCAGQLW